MQQLVIIRGLPGSGKSTMARLWASQDPSNRIHVEADMWFERDGEYKFDARKLSEAHKWCQQTCETALLQGKSVVVSNTFVKLWEMQSYLNMAKDLNTVVQVKQATGDFVNVHGVPQEVINRMRDSWENFTQENHTMNKIIVKKQTEVGSKNWGVYVNGRLVEGGFFSRGAAEQCADNWRREVAQETV